MKNLLKKNSIIILLIILFIISGTITLFIAGFEKDVNYAAGTRIEVYIPNGYEKQDIINIAKESFGERKIAFEEVEKLNQVAGIKVDNNYTEEELNKFKASICEKYEIKEDSLELHEIQIPATRIRTAVTPYVFPVVLVTILSLIYMLFRNLKSENKWKVIFKIVLALAITLGVYFSLIVVLRLPFTDYTMPLALAIYIVTLIILVNKK